MLLDGKSIYQSHFLRLRSESNCCELRTRGKCQEFVPFLRRTHFSRHMYDTKKSETIEGTIWQAGADPDDILLGVSFVAHDQVLLNTIHIVRPGEPTESKLDTGLVIKTYIS